MQFAQFRPSGQLSSVVKTIWVARGSREEFADPAPIVPDGSVELVFNLGAPFVGPDGDLQPADLLAGQMTTPVMAVPTGDVDLIGVRLRSSRAGAAFRTPMWQLQDNLVAASSVMGGFDRLAGELRAIDVDSRLSYLQDQLASRWGDADGDRLQPVDHAIALIQARRGAVTIEEIAKRVGLTRRHLERRFLDEVGLTMKDLARITRMHAALELIESPREMSGAEIAAACGFSDQAHLIRECRELTGQTPARFRTGESLGGLIRESPL